MVGTTIEIDLAALRYNLSQVMNLVGQTAAILGVVKSDAYGHGMIPVARELVHYGVEYLGVSTCREAVTLRQAGIKAPVLLFLGVENDELTEVIQHCLTPVVYRSDTARAISAAAVQANVQIPVHLKIDTGMGRLGIPFGEAEKFFEFIRTLDGIKVEGLLSHFASADQDDKSFSKRQLELFRSVLSLGERLGLNFRYAHIANFIFSWFALDSCSTALHHPRNSIIPSSSNL